VLYSYQRSGKWVAGARWHVQLNLVFLIVTTSVCVHQSQSQQLQCAFGAMFMVWGAIVLLSEDRLRQAAAAAPGESLETTICACMCDGSGYQFSVVQAEALCAWTAGSLLFIVETDNGVAMVASATLLLLGAYR